VVFVCSEAAVVAALSGSGSGAGGGGTLLAGSWDAVSAKERYENLSRPHIPHGESIFERRILLFELLEAFQDSLSGPCGRLSFTGIRCVHPVQVYLVPVLKVGF
jgi:hypothetical protein